MSRLEIPEIFSDAVSQPINNLIEEAQANGARVIGYTCSYVPEPLLSVEGLIPLRMRAPGVVGTPMADTYLSNFICTYTRSLMEFALEGTYNSLDGWVYTASCDHLRRLYDNVSYLINPGFNHILDLPHRHSPTAVAWYAEELRGLAAALQEKFRVDISAKALQQAISRQNEYLALMRQITELRRLDKPPISGADFHTLMVAGAVSPKAKLLEYLRQVASDTKSADGIDNFRTRVMVVGSELDDPEYLRVIESMGALVAIDRVCLGSFPGLELIEQQDDPFVSLADHYLGRISCPRMMEGFEARLADIIRLAQEYRVDGIILQTMKFCDTWGVEAGMMVSALREAGYPMLRLEREYALSGEGQLRTRIQAFIESLGK